MRRRYSLVKVLLESDEIEKVPDSSMQAQLTRAQSVMKALLPKAVRAFTDLYTDDEMKKFIEDISNEELGDDDKGGLDTFLTGFRRALESDSGRIFVNASARILEPVVSDMSAYMGSRLRGMWLNEAISDFLLGESGFPIVLFNPIIRSNEEGTDIDYEIMASRAIYSLVEKVVDTIIRKERKLGTGTAFTEQVVAKSYKIKDMISEPERV